MPTNEELFLEKLKEIEPTLYTVYTIIREHPVCHGQLFFEVHFRDKKPERVFFDRTRESFEIPRKNSLQFFF